jgi:hypothetical protein
MRNATFQDLSERFVLRMTPSIRDAVKESAAQNNRSMNAEILARLEDSYQNAARREEITDWIRQNENAIQQDETLQERLIGEMELADPETANAAKLMMAMHAHINKVNAMLDHSKERGGHPSYDEIQPMLGWTYRHLSDLDGLDTQLVEKTQRISNIRNHYSTIRRSLINILSYFDPAPRDTPTKD